MPTLIPYKQAPQRSPVDDLAERIAKRESGGRYDAKSPPNPGVGRALGKYQIVEANLPSWSKEAIGRSVSSDEYIRNPQLQETIAKYHIAKIRRTYGNDADTASVWHSGRPLAKATAAGARDMLGTTTEQYVKDVTGNFFGVSTANAAGEKKIIPYPQATGNTLSYSQTSEAPAQEQRPGFIQGLAQAIAKPALRVGLSAARAEQGIGQLMGGNEQSRQKYLAGIGKPKDFGYLGSVSPLGYSDTGEQLSMAQGLKQTAGTAAEVASYGIGGGGVARVGKEFVRGTFREGFKQGAKIGIAGGAMGQGGAELARPESTLGSTLGQAGIGAVTGGVLGGAIGGITGGVGGAVTRRTTKAAEERALLAAASPDARVASKVIGASGRISKDKVAQDAIKQGISTADVALIKGSGKADRAKMEKMLDMRILQKNNKRVTERASDVVGNTFTEKVVKPLVALNKDAAKKLDVVAGRLSGRKVNTTPALGGFADALGRAGVKVRKSGTLVFKNSNFEGMRGVQGIIQNIWLRANRVARTGDALQAHRLKAYIDEIVNYGKATEGLSGKAQGMIKTFRHDVDAVLDIQFPAYNKANTVYADTIKRLNDMGVFLGRSFRLGDNFADAQSGIALRRLFSNAQGRAQMLRVLDEMQSTLKKYGIKLDEDVINQAAFVDALEKMGEFGPEATTGIAGEFQKGLEMFGSSGGFGGLQQAGSAAGELARGNLVRSGIKAFGLAVDAVRNINSENKIKALRTLLRSGRGIGK